jgi:hypothetical protein
LRATNLSPSEGYGESVHNWGDDVQRAPEQESVTQTVASTQQIVFDAGGFNSGIQSTLEELNDKQIVSLAGGFNSRIQSTIVAAPQAAPNDEAGGAVFSSGGTTRFRKKAHHLVSTRGKIGETGSTSIQDGKPCVSVSCRWGGIPHPNTK